MHFTRIKVSKNNKNLQSIQIGNFNFGRSCRRKDFKRFWRGVFRRMHFWRWVFQRMRFWRCIFLMNAFTDRSRRVAAAVQSSWPSSENDRSQFVNRWGAIYTCDIFSTSTRGALSLMYGNIIHRGEYSTWPYIVYIELHLFNASLHWITTFQYIHSLNCASSQPFPYNVPIPSSNIFSRQLFTSRLRDPVHPVHRILSHPDLHPVKVRSAGGSKPIKAFGTF